MGAFAWIMVVTIAGYTASFVCVVLERGGMGEAGGRSACVCGQPIPMARNIPVMSWISQRGRAACCGARIPVWYVLSEAGTVAAAVTGGVLGGLPGAVAGIVVGCGATAVWHRVESE